VDREEVLRRDALDAWRAGVRAASPVAAMERALAARPEIRTGLDRTLVVATGKAAAAMLRGVGPAAKGVAIVPDKNATELAGLEQGKWEKMTDAEKEKLLFKFDKPVPEKKITQEMRQQEFDNYQTTDDHGMQFTGIVKDQNGNEYYMVKNSWGGEDHRYKGFFYASKPYVQLKTMDIMVHKNAIPKEIRKKLGL